LKLRHPVGDCGDHISRGLLRCGTFRLSLDRIILLTVSFFSLDDFDSGFRSHNNLLLLMIAKLLTFWFSLFNEMLSSKFDFFFRLEGSAAYAALILANNGPQIIDEWAYLICLIIYSIRRTQRLPGWIIFPTRPTRLSSETNHLWLYCIH
jgi:hypothetical protein